MPTPKPSPETPPKHIVIVAGEESGDRHAADLISALQANSHELRITGIGGQHMRNAGAEILVDLARYGVTGLTAVIRHLRVIYQAFKTIQAHLLESKPDLLILVDYPGFNLRLAKFAKQHHIRVLYYISPQIWAWKANRIHTIRRTVDHMAVILPFEKKLYEQVGVPVSFVGHPLVNEIQLPSNPLETRKKLGLPPDTKLIALLPGSRSQEIAHHMPVLMETAERLHQLHPTLHFVIPIAATISPKCIESYVSQTTLPINLVQGKAVEVAGCSDCIIVASGTASLECALLEKPMCIIYKGSFISYLITCAVIRVNYFGLCNLLENRMIVPEFLQYDCNASELVRTVHDLLTNQACSNALVQRLQNVKRTLSSEQADATISDVVRKLIHLSAT